MASQLTIDQEKQRLLLLVEFESGKWNKQPLLAQQKKILTIISFTQLPTMLAHKRSTNSNAKIPKKHAGIQINRRLI